MASLTDLSNELLLHIFKHLSLQDVLALSYQCRKLAGAVSLHLRLCKTIDLCEGHVDAYMPISLTDDHLHFLLLKCPHLNTLYGLNPAKVERRRLRRRSILTVPGVLDALSLCSELEAVGTNSVQLLEAILQHMPHIRILGKFQNRDGLNTHQRLKLRPFPSISSLHLVGVEIGELPSMPQLEHLFLERVHFTRLHPFGTFQAPSLQTFVLRYCLNPIIALRYLPLIVALSSATQLGRLEIIGVPFPGGLFQRAVEDSYRSGGFSMLHTLVVAGCRGILEPDVGHLMVVSSGNLEKVRLQSSLTRDGLVFSLAYAGCSFPRLTSLHLGYNDPAHLDGTVSPEYREGPATLTDSGMRAVGRLFPALRSLSVANCPHLVRPDQWSSGGEFLWLELRDLNIYRCHCLQIHPFALFLGVLRSIQVVVLHDIFREPPKGCSHVGLSAGTGLGMSSAVVSNQEEHLAVAGGPDSDEDEGLMADEADQLEQHIVVLQQEFFDDENLANQEQMGPPIPHHLLLPYVPPPNPRSPSPPPNPRSPSPPVPCPSPPSVEPVFPTSPSPRPFSPVSCENSPACPSIPELRPYFPPSPPLARPSPLPGHSSPLAGPSPLVGPSSPLVGPSSPLAGPSSPLAGPSSPLAGPSSPFAGPSSPLAEPPSPLDEPPQSPQLSPSYSVLPSSPLVIPPPCPLTSASENNLNQNFPVLTGEKGQGEDELIEVLKCDNDSNGLTDKQKLQAAIESSLLISASTNNSSQKRSKHYSADSKISCRRKCNGTSSFDPSQPSTSRAGNCSSSTCTDNGNCKNLNKVRNKRSMCDGDEKRCKPPKKTKRDNYEKEKGSLKKNKTKMRSYKGPVTRRRGKTTKLTVKPNPRPAKRTSNCLSTKKTNSRKPAVLKKRRHTDREYNYPWYSQCQRTMVYCREAFVSQGTQVCSQEIRRALRRHRGCSTNRSSRRSCQLGSPPSHLFQHNEISARQFCKTSKPHQKTHCKTTYDKSTSTSDPLMEDDAVQMLRLVSGTLISLSIISCGISEIVLSNCTSITHLEAVGCRILKKIRLQNCPQLCRIRVSECPKMSIHALLNSVLNDAPSPSLLCCFEPCNYRECDAAYMEQAVLLESYKKDSISLCFDYGNLNTGVYLGETLLLWTDALRAIRVSCSELQPKLKNYDEKFPYGHSIRRIHGTSTQDMHLSYQIVTNDLLMSAHLETIPWDKGLPAPPPSLNCMPELLLNHNEDFKEFKRHISIYVPYLLPLE